MVGFIEGLADWEVKHIIDTALKPYVAKGEITAEQVPVVEQAAMDVLNLVAAELLAKQQGKPPA